MNNLPIQSTERFEMCFDTLRQPGAGCNGLSNTTPNLSSSPLSKYHNSQQKLSPKNSSRSQKFGMMSNENNFNSNFYGIFSPCGHSLKQRSSKFANAYRKSSDRVEPISYYHQHHQQRPLCACTKCGGGSYTSLDSSAANTPRTFSGTSSSSASKASSREDILIQSEDGIIDIDFSKVQIPLQKRSAPVYYQEEKAIGK